MAAVFCNSPYYGLLQKENGRQKMHFYPSVHRNASFCRGGHHRKLYLSYPDNILPYFSFKNGSNFVGEIKIL